MADPDLGESAWERAKADAAGVYKTPLFGVATTVVGLIAAGIAALLTTDPQTSTETRVVVPVLAGLIAIVVVTLSVVAFQLAVAPVRQRNAARGVLDAVPVERPPDVELTLRNYARQAEDRSTQIATQGGWVKADVEFTEQWTEEVVRFLSDRAPTYAAEFTALATSTRGVQTKLDLRASKLREIADSIRDQ